MKASPEKVAEAIEALAEHLAELEGCENNSYILAFKGGLGVRFPEPGKPAVCSLAQAEEVANEQMPEEAWAFIPRVVNGNGEVAQVVRRQVAIAEHMKVLEKLIGEFKAA